MVRLPTCSLFNSKTTHRRKVVFSGIDREGPEKESGGGPDMEDWIKLEKGGIKINKKNKFASVNKV